jgi:hypothetical protein
LYAAELFQNTYIGHAVRFSKLAIQASPAGVDAAPLWNTVVKGSTELALYDEAYAAIVSMPYEKQYVLLSPRFLLLLTVVYQEERMCLPTGCPHVRGERRHKAHDFRLRWDGR